MTRSPNADMRSPIDEECWFEDHREPVGQARADEAYARFKAGTLAPEYDTFLARQVCVERSRRGLNASFEVA